MKKSAKIIITIVAVIFAFGAGITAFRFIAPESFEKIFGVFTGKTDGEKEPAGSRNNDPASVGNNDPAQAGNKGNTGSEGENTAGTPTQEGSTNTSQAGDLGTDAKDEQQNDGGSDAGQIKDNAGNSNYSDLFAMYSSAMAETPQLDRISLPQDENEISFELAMQALTLCSGGTRTGQAALLTKAGFEVVLQDGYDKANTDISHTCAFTVGKKKIDFYGEEKTLYVIVVRGTSGSEWFSNFDYADSHTDDSKYAENFLEAAQVISIKLIPVLAAEPDALILVSGHSRGAAAANLLGMTLDDMYGQEGKYIYTFATPNTYRGDPEAVADKYRNIFNFINPADVVTEVPLKAMGYSHIGKDIILPCEPETAIRIASEMEVLHKVSPSIEAYYTVRHSLTGAGLSEDGYTANEIMQALASSLAGIKMDINGGINMQDVYEIIDSAPHGKESDLAPLVDLISKLIGRDGTYGVGIFMQHMPTTYAQLIQVYAKMYYSAMPEGTAP